MDSALRAAKMFELKKQSFVSVVSGNFREARKYYKEFAKAALEDFEVYKTLPNISFSNVPWKVWFSLVGMSIRYRIFSLFTRKTPEEKQLAQLYKDYAKTMTPEDKQKKTLDITLPSLY